MIYAIGHVSGAHMNSAVTAGFMRRRGGWFRQNFLFIGALSASGGGSRERRPAADVP